VVFDGWRQYDIEVSIASVSPRWATRRVVGTILAYPFNQLQCVRITGITPLSNAKAQNLVKRLGFKQEGILRRGFVDDDAVIVGMLREEAEPWLRHVEPGLIENEQGRPTATARA